MVSLAQMPIADGT